ncbi:amidohydrolase family protein [Mycobacterium sp. URHB0021]
MWIDDRHGAKVKLAPEICTAIIDEAHRVGLPVAAHIYTTDDAKNAVRAGADILAHLPRTGADPELTDMMVKDDVIAFTSLSIQRPDGTAWLDDPLAEELVSEDTRAHLRERIKESAPAPMFDSIHAYEQITEALRQLFDAGVHVVFSADTSLLTQIPGLAEHRELAAMADAGISINDVIATAPSKSAALLDRDSGMSAPGRRADLLVLNSNPLDDMGNTRRIHSIYLDGELVDRHALHDRFLEF